MLCKLPARITPRIKNQSLFDRSMAAKQSEAGEAARVTVNVSDDMEEKPANVNVNNKPAEAEEEKPSSLSGVVVVNDAEPEWEEVEMTRRRSDQARQLSSMTCWRMRLRRPAAAGSYSTLT